MTQLVIIMLVFLAVGIGFLVVNLFVGKLIRPNRPNAEKGTIYECGESPVGSSWIQFDLRFYVVALLFVIFDVEMAFFFPWAVVFGTSNELAKPDLTTEQRIALQQRLATDNEARRAAAVQQKKAELGRHEEVDAAATANQNAAKALARLAFIDVLVFFGVLLVGFAYLWKRGDLEWVRGMAGQIDVEPVETPAATANVGGA
jgi:NADH-quinone oxidoreductase subunit A